jgi:hypothetical protein
MNMGFTLRSQARRMHPAESRLFPTDCPFPFRCSPPRLAATQLRSGTNLKGRFGGNFHPSICLRPLAHERRRLAGIGLRFVFMKNTVGASPEGA